MKYVLDTSLECGTIAAHEEIIEKLGYVWYGKMSFLISRKIVDEIMLAEQPQILMIRSGKTERYWAKLEKIQYEISARNEFLAYYRGVVDKFKTWF